MSQINGYSIYLAPVTSVPVGPWTVRAYRDADDQHIHSAEGLPLEVSLRIVAKAIADDVMRDLA